MHLWLATEVSVFSAFFWELNSEKEAAGFITTASFVDVN